MSHYICKSNRSILVLFKEVSTLYKVWMCECKVCSCLCLLCLYYLSLCELIFCLINCCKKNPQKTPQKSICIVYPLIIISTSRKKWPSICTNIKSLHTFDPNLVQVSWYKSRSYRKISMFDCYISPFLSSASQAMVIPPMKLSLNLRRKVPRWHFSKSRWESCLLMKPFMNLQRKVLNWWSHLWIYKRKFEPDEAINEYTKDQVINKYHNKYLHATFQINYANMQHKPSDMWHIYVNMQDNYMYVKCM